MMLLSTLPVDLHSATFVSSSLKNGKWMTIEISQSIMEGQF